MTQDEAKQLLEKVKRDASFDHAQQPSALAVMLAQQAIDKSFEGGIPPVGVLALYDGGVSVRYKATYLDDPEKDGEPPKIETRESRIEITNGGLLTVITQTTHQQDACRFSAKSVGEAVKKVFLFLSP